MKPLELISVGSLLVGITSVGAGIFIELSRQVSGIENDLFFLMPVGFMLVLMSGTILNIISKRDVKGQDSDYTEGEQDE